MSNINKRLDNLEGAADPHRGYVVLYCDPHQPGIYYDQPASAKDRRKYSEADRRELEGRHNLILVEYVSKPLPGSA